MFEIIMLAAFAYAGFCHLPVPHAPPATKNDRLDHDGLKLKPTGGRRHKEALVGEGKSDRNYRAKVLR